MAQLVAHRGQNIDCPENTLEALGRALRCGAAAVEFDLQMSSDLIPVVCHDMSLQRTAGVGVDIAGQRYAQLATFRVGEPARLGAAFPTVALPALREVVALLSTAPQVTAFVELKAESIAHFGVECFVQQVAVQLQPVARQCVVIADSLEALLVMRKRLPLRIGWILHRWDEADRVPAREYGLDYLVMSHEHCLAREHDFAADPWGWVVYETADPQLAAALFARGVQYVETNDICHMVEQLPGHRARGKL